MTDRDFEKARRFGELWGTNPGILLQKHDLTVKEAQTLLERLKKRYPGIRAYLQGLRLWRAPKESL